MGTHGKSCAANTLLLTLDRHCRFVCKVCVQLCRWQLGSVVAPCLCVAVPLCCLCIDLPQYVLTFVRLTLNPMPLGVQYACCCASILSCSCTGFAHVCAATGRRNAPNGPYCYGLCVLLSVPSDWVSVSGSKQQGYHMAVMMATVHGCLFCCMALARLLAGRSLRVCWMCCTRPAAVFTSSTQCVQ